MVNNTQPLVTICIPTYNRADAFLKKAITCAVNQTYQNIEIVVSDNASTDHTEEIVKDFTDQRIRYFKQKENIGAINNFNFCLSQTQGDYMLLLLDDDLVDDDFVEIYVQAANTDKEAAIIRGGLRLIDGEGNVLAVKPNRAAGLSPHEYIRAWYNGDVAMYICSVLYNTEKLREVGGFYSKYNLFVDVVPEIKLLVKYSRLDIPVVKASFRMHDNNLGSTAKVSAWCDDSIYILNLICDLIPDQEKQLRREGMFFFCKMNYARAAKIKSFFNHYISYFIVAKYFKYSYSPFRYIYKKELRQVLRRTKKVLQS